MVKYELLIRLYRDPTDQEHVLKLWDKNLQYSAPHNSPELAIKNKLAMNDNLFFVAILDNKLVGTVTAGYDGHRGWIYSLAVFPEYQKQGIGAALMEKAESALSDLGCVKINLQINPGNEQVIRFYEDQGFAVEERVSMGKKLPDNY